MAKGVTIKDVAAEAGVSFKTVSNVINGTGSMRESTRGRVLEAMDKLNYTINLSARSLKTGTTGLLGLAIFDFSQPFASYLADQIIVCAREHHYGVIINTYGQNEHGLARAMRQANNLAADGWIVFADHAMGQHSKMLDQSYPLVLTGDWDAYGKVDQVTMPNVEAMRYTTNRLLDSGYRSHRAVRRRTARSAQDITDKPPRVRRNSACKGICRHTRSMASRPAWTCCSQVAY
jgi:DNA-binding LacI/PurR family transcriptional regulator